MWYRFMDMHSGGSLKTDYSRIFIEADTLKEAKSIFYSRFDRNPDQITCSCCGEDYSISQSKTLKNATGFDRGCYHLKWPTDSNGRYIPTEKLSEEQLEVLESSYEKDEPVPKGYVADKPWGEYKTLEEYIASDDVLVIYASEIEKHEKKHEIPQRGWVWVG